MNGTAIQDWDAPGGVSFIQYSWEHNLETVPFTWSPNESATTITGNVIVRALEMGGDVNTRITADFEWPLAGDPVATWPTTTAAEAPSYNTADAV